MSEIYGSYEEYSKTLRTWFVAYGVGAPVIFLSNEALTTKVLSAPTSRCLIAAFFAGVLVQVILTIINKHAMWGCYYGEIKPEFQSTYRYKIADWLSSQYWIDIIIDFISLALLSYASFGIYKILM